MNDKLIKIQQELKAPKNQYNSFGGYDYRSCEDILEAVKPLLAREKLLLTINDKIVKIGERYYVRATASLRDEEKNCIKSIAYAREEETKKGMDGSQITGASSSYARKYALNGLFLIDDSKDSDTTNRGEEKQEKSDVKLKASSSNPISAKQRGYIYSLYKEKNGEEMPEEQKEKIRKLSAKQASELIEKWKEKVEDKQLEEEETPENDEKEIGNNSGKHEVIKDDPDESEEEILDLENLPF